MYMDVAKEDMEVQKKQSILCYANQYLLKNEQFKKMIGIRGL